MKKRTFTLICSLLCLLLAALPLRAEDIAGLMPATFTRVTAPSQLTPDGLYAFGGIKLSDKAWFMKAEILGQTGKLKPLPGDNSHGPTYLLKNPDEVWRIAYNEEGHLLLTGAVNGKLLCRKANGKLGLTLQKGGGTSNAGWVIETGPGDTFFLIDPTRSDRMLSLGGDSNGFDNYSDPQQGPFAALYIYKLGGTAEISGRATLPADGARVALCNNGLARTPGGAATSTAPLALCNGSLADDGTVEVWTCRHTGNGRFVLENGRGALGYDLNTVTGAAPEWQVSAGRFVTLEATPRTLCFDATARRWTVTASAGGLTEGLLATVAPAPGREISPKGVVTLTGGWPAAALAATDLTDATCLDLTGAVLPAKPLAFRTNLAECNLPIFVSETMTAAVPTSWPLVVSCGKVNRLLRPYQLKDRAAFYTDRPITIGSGDLTYSRTFDGRHYWQTFCLPFTPAWVGADCFRVSIGEGGVLQLTQAAGLLQGQAYLVRYDKTGPLTFTSLAGTMEPNNPRADAPLQGVLQPYEVPDGATDIFLFSSSANEFARAAAGSRLAPFRCYLRPGTARSPRLKLW